MQQDNSYKNFLINEYKLLKEFKSKYTLKVILKNVLENLGYESIKDNEVILHNLASMFEINKTLIQIIDDVFLYNQLGQQSVENQKEQYYKLVENYFKNKIIYSENETEAKLTFKYVSYDNEEKEYTKSQLFRCINNLGSTYESPNSAILSKIDFIYNKKSKETIINDLKMNVFLAFANHQKLFNTYAMVKTDTYNSNNRMVESMKIDRINKFFKYDIENLEDIIPNEDEYFDLEILRDNGASALFIKKNKEMDIQIELPIKYDIEEINYYKGNKFLYGNESLRGIYHKSENKPLKVAGVNQLKVEEMLLNNLVSKDDVILNNDEELFSRIYKFSENDMIDLTKSIVQEELSSKKLTKNIR